MRASLRLTALAAGAFLCGLALTGMADAQTPATGLAPNADPPVVLEIASLETPPVPSSSGTQAADDRVVVTARHEPTVDERIDELFDRITESSCEWLVNPETKERKLKSCYMPELQAEAGVALSVIKYAKSDNDDERWLPIFILGVKPGKYTFQDKGSWIFGYTCARNGVGKTDVVTTSIREAVTGTEIQRRCDSASGPVRLKYIGAYTAASIEPAELPDFVKLIDYRPHVKDALAKIEASDDHNNIADAIGDPDHGTAGMRTSSRFAWTRGPTPF